MKTRAWCVVALSLCACKPPQKPPPPPAPVASATAEPPKVEEPPKKCENLDDGCIANEKSVASIGASGLVFTPPVGWKYAHAGEIAIAASDDATIAITIVPKHTMPALHGAFDALLGKMVLSPIKRKPLWWLRPPDKVDKVGELKVSLWQLDGGERGSKRGPLLLFSAPLRDGTEVLGIGFVPADDKSSADEAILKAVASIAPASKAP